MQPRYNLDEARLGRRAPLAAPAAPSRQEQPPLLPRRLPAGDASAADADRKRATTMLRQASAPGSLRVDKL